MNYMKEVTELLGVEIGEEFRVSCDGAILPDIHKFTNESLLSTYNRTLWMVNYARLGNLLNGRVSVVKEPWKPKEGEKYYRIGINMHDERTVWHCVWGNDITDIMRYKLGNCFKTEEEAISNIDAYLEWVHSAPLIDWRNKS